MEPLHIYWMYPDILNLHGDRGNLMALQRVAKLMGLEAQITRIENYEQPIDYDKADLLFFTSGEVKSVDPIVKRLAKDREALDAYLEAGKMVVAIGTSGAIFANKLTRQDGSVVEGLGVLDMDAVERDAAYGDDLQVKLDAYLDDEIIGSQIQLVEFHLAGGTRLGTTVYGRGNRLEGKAEGAIYKNVLFTNLLGPALVKNPWFAEALLREVLKTKGAELPEKLPEETFDLERKSAACIRRFIEEKTK